MSGLISGLVWNLDIPQNEKYVLHAYADHADHEGKNVKPGIELIAWKTGYTERNVQKIINKLREKKILIPVKHAEGGRGHSVEYHIAFPPKYMRLRENPEPQDVLYRKGVRTDTVSTKDEPQDVLSVQNGEPGDTLSCYQTGQRVNRGTLKGELASSPETSGTKDPDPDLSSSFEDYKSEETDETQPNPLANISPYRPNLDEPKSPADTRPYQQTYDFSKNNSAVEKAEADRAAYESLRDQVAESLGGMDQFSRHANRCAAQLRAKDNRSPPSPMEIVEKLAEELGVKEKD